MATLPRMIILFLALAFGAIIFVSTKGRRDADERQERFDQVMQQARDVSASDTSSSSVQGIHDQVANEAIEQYKIAKRQGDAIQTCVAASSVVASLLQAKNEARYREWKEIEDLACKRAGIEK